MSKKKQHHEEHIDETWLIPYADMLTLLLALFIVMFAVSQVDTKKFEALKKAMESVFKGGSGIMANPTPLDTEGASDAPPDMSVMESLKETRDLQEIKNRVDRYIEEKGLEKQVETNLVREGLQISFRDAALFDSGKADLKREALPALDLIADTLHNLSNEVRIAGHTDNLPISTAEFPSNWDLSAKRALNVMKYILNDKRNNPVKFTAVGYGEYHPKATNDTPEGRAQNRRVEVMIIRQYPMPGQKATPAVVKPVPEPLAPQGNADAMPPAPVLEGLPGEPKRLPADKIPDSPLRFVP
ncbi:flagellar motor protein motb, putative [Heliomicrobium modesticaldum Ice1]|uniref:Flagellar motor protein motb, putative n=1 Tax=Heliobacterium modesticaldum (strain ATCC 51547 / Ice1) TaxID=498761 RepID=B0TCQ1_HELMI|nr:flagellar motor protein MotB [Heliomicrobium modesticaldum]ABZ84077.1 flagellar motor protein motb, putative [Heliomicrobium modesticaldum Ice1]